MQEENQTLREVVCELDGIQGGINARLFTLEHIKNSFLNLDEDMTNITDPTDMKIFFNEARETVHLLSHLMRYTVLDLVDDVAKLREIKETQWNIVIRKGGQAVNEQ